MKNKMYVILANAEGAEWSKTMPVFVGGLRFVLEHFEKEYKNFQKSNFHYNLWWLVRLNDEYNADTPVEHFFKHVNDNKENWHSYNCEPFMSFVDLGAPMRNRGLLADKLHEND